MQQPLEGTPTYSLAEVLRMDVTKEWVYQRWPRKSTALSDLDLYGVRVPLVTGAQLHDLAGSLTYYFAVDGRVQRISFRGRTGDTRQLVGMVTQRYGLTPQPSLVAGEQLFELRRGADLVSRLSTRPAPVLWASSPHDSFSVELDLQDPATARPLLLPMAPIPAPTTAATGAPPGAAGQDGEAAQDDEPLPTGWKAFFPRRNVPESQLQTWTTATSTNSRIGIGYAVGMIDALVTVCQVEHRASALRMLHAARDESHQESLAHAVAAVPADDGDAWSGLFVAEESKPPGAVWVQPLPGNTAVVWPPPPDCPAFDALLRAAAAYVDAQRIALAQIIVGGDEGFSPELLEQCGFAQLAELNYMVADSAEKAESGTKKLDHLMFLPRAGDYPERLAALVELTYVGTQDCPRLDGVRRIDDVLAGYRAQGRRLPNHWYIVRDREHNEPADSQDLGVLILAEHPGTESWELVYMGVIPRARGRGLGAAIVRFALDTAARGGAQRLVLAVDAANAPALVMYLRSGFVAWDRRFVYARMGA